MGTGPLDARRRDRFREVDARDEAERAEALLDALPVGLVFPGGANAYARRTGLIALVPIADGVVEHGERRYDAQTVHAPVGDVTVFVDVTLREQRLDAEREFSATAAHELQTPVAGILGVVEALRTGAKDDPERLARFLGHLAREGRRLDRLSNALLVVARARHTGRAVRLELTALRPLLLEVVEGTGRAKDVQIAVTCDDDVGALTHRDVLFQILANLIGNAARHTHAGTIGIAATLRGQARVEVIVSDTGTGIANAEQGRVFRRYERGDVNAGSAGLGLAIAQELVGVVGGRLELIVSSPRGTTFAINLPGARLTP